MKTLLSLIFITALFGCSSSSSSEVVGTSKGKLQGYEKNVVNYFLGIPYAEAPIGEVRWQSPKPVKAWQGIKSVNA